MQVPKGTVLLSSGCVQLWGWGAMGECAWLGSLTLLPFLTKALLSSVLLLIMRCLASSQLFLPLLLGQEDNHAESQPVPPSSRSQHIPWLHPWLWGKATSHGTGPPAVLVWVPAVL